MTKPADRADHHDTARQGVTQTQPFAIDGATYGAPAAVPSRRRCGVRLVGRSVESGGWMVCGDRHAEPQAPPHTMAPSDIA